jgi:hypothetical protein
MATSQEKAQQLCSKTEWDTLVNSFPPRLSELPPAVLKKQANRVRRFLDKEKASESGTAERIALFEEALQRLEAARPAEAGENEKLAARREKEKIAREREKSLRARRQEVKAKLQEKADKEKAEKEGEPKEEDAKKKTGVKGVRAHLQAAARSQGKIGTRKV